MIKRFIPALSGKAEKPVERRIPQNRHKIRKEKFSPLALSVVDKLLEEGHEAYIVGGCIRDMLLGKEPKDFDVATSATPEQVQRLFKRARIIGRRFKIVHVQDRREIIEVTTFRGNHKSSNDRHASQSKEGVLIRDNVYGSLEEDALRRDFTCNSLYFDIDSEEVVDFLDGVSDVKSGLLRTIGNPDERFKEDPVRMMRALRFQAKLGLKLDKNSQKQLQKNIAMIREVSAARLFDEVIKLLMHEQAQTAYSLMLKTGLFAQLFPGSAEIAQKDASKALFISTAMQGTENRLRSDKRVSPFYLYASLLWPAVEKEFQHQLSNNPPSRAMDIAGGKIINDQAPLVSIARRFSISMRETWYLQTQLGNRHGDRANRLLEHPRFRAAYDFLLMREKTGEDMQGLGDWWTRFQSADNKEREKMLAALPQQKSSRRRRRPRKRKPSRAD